MQIVEKNGRKIAIIDPAEKINNVQEALDLMATAQYQGDSHTLVIYKDSFAEDFFDLKTRFAGEVLQKFSNYRVLLAIVGDFSVYDSKALRDFIYECNKGNQVFWVGSVDEALDALAPDRR
jgi:hypothetical protein